MKRTRKRIICILAAAALSVCSLPQSTPFLLRPALTVNAEDIANPAPEFTYTNIGTGIQITGWNGSGETVVIPSEINGLPVDEISGSAFKNQTLLTKIIIPDSVEAIGQNAFYGCLSLTEINIPDGVTTIAYNTFAKCGELKSITIPESVTSIGKRAFDGTALTTVTLPEHLTEIGQYAFNTCYDLRSIVIPDGVAEISDFAFYDCRRLKSVTLPKNLKRIGISAFAHCGSLNSITLPDGTERIDSAAFQKSGLTEITIPASAAAIGGDSFGDCSISLTIKGYTDSFAESYANEHDIPFESLGDTSAENVADGNCGENLTWTLDSEGTLTVSGTGEMPDVLYTPWFDHMSQITTAVIEDGVTSIGDYAFLGCVNLTDITIPDSVTRIGSDAFNGCTGLTEITIPGSIAEISMNAFTDCTGLMNVEIQEGVTRISSQAFSGCTSLNCVTIPISVIEISERMVFDGCSDLTIYGYPGSFAKTYANTYGFPFVSLGDPEIPVNDWAEKSVISKNTEEAEFVVRVGDIDACNDENAVADHGYDPFTAKSQYAHGYPWLKDETDPAGTDRIFVGSKWNGDSTDGYASNYVNYKNGSDKENAYGDGALSFTLEYDASEIDIENVILQLCIDDFQALSWESNFTVKLNGKDAPFIAELLNHTDQTGPTAYIVSAMIPSGFFEDIASGKLTVVIDETTGVGDGYAIDFARLLINYDEQIFTGTFSGKTEPGATVRLLGTSTTVTASPDGSFTFNAIPGINAVRASKTGFAEKYDSGIVLSSGTEWKPELSLEEGEGSPDIDFSEFAETGKPLKGDYNGDKEITAADAVLLARLVSEDTTLTEEEIYKILIAEPDYDGDGLVTILDVTALLKTLGEA